MFFVIRMHVIYALLCVTVVGCYKKPLPLLEQQCVSCTSSSFDDEQLNRIIEQETLLINVPLPLYDKRIIPTSDSVNNDTIFLGYESPLSLEQATNFFMCQMERYGWNLLVSFEAIDTL